MVISHINTSFVWGVSQQILRVCRRLLRSKSLKTAFIDELVIVCVTLGNVIRQDGCAGEKTWIDSRKKKEKMKN